MRGQRSRDLDQLYLLLERLADHHGGPRRLADCRGGDGWPTHGTYFFYEDGELRGDGRPRVVRVGTHALTATSRTTLWRRLSQHRGSTAGGNPGGGNHRGSIFRRHVGTALIRRGGHPEPLLRSWLAGKPEPHHEQLERAVERQVSTVIGVMPFLWVEVPTRSDGSSDRGFIERNAIALLSGITGPADPPSPSWLGHHSVSDHVRASGLWNVNHVDELYRPAFLDALAGHIP